MRERVWRRLGPTLLGAVAIWLVAATAVSAAPSTTTEPIADFVRVQGTTCFPDGQGGCILFTPPVQNYVFWGNTATDRVAAVDYAGLENAYITSHGGASLGTAFSGSVTRRPLAGGTEEISVILHTRHAASRAFRFSDGTPLFGYSAPEVLAGARPALGDSLLEVVYVNPVAGMPIADLGQLGFAPLPGQVVRVLHFEASAAGGLRPGFGVPDGSPGHLTVNQVGLIGLPWGMRHPDDPFPVELIDIGRT